MTTNQTNGQIVTKGVVGTISSFGAWVVANVQHINALLQMGCLTLGFTISAITLWKLVTKKRKSKDHEN